MPDPTPVEPFLDLPEGDSLEQLDSQVQRTQAQLLDLRRQQELLEKQKRDLEEASRRQEQFTAGRQEMVEQFTRSLVVIERETYDTQKRVEQLKSIHAMFSQHLDSLEAINPKHWEGGELSFIHKELNKSLSAVEDARAEFSNARALINANVPAAEEVLAAAPAEGGYQMDYEHSGERAFGYWLKSGFAFTLPLLVLGVLFLLIHLFGN